MFNEKCNYAIELVSTTKTALAAQFQIEPSCMKLLLNGEEMLDPLSLADFEQIRHRHRADIIVEVPYYNHMYWLHLHWFSKHYLMVVVYV